MDEQPPAAPANIVRRDGLYHLLMLVEGEWLDTGVTSARLVDITAIAKREFGGYLIDAPTNTPPKPKVA